MLVRRPLCSRFEWGMRVQIEAPEIAGDFEGPGGTRRISVDVADGGRTAYLDGKAQDRLDEYFEGLAAVAFTPDDLL
jgi:DNA replication and repair protein RecF